MLKFVSCLQTAFKSAPPRERASVATVMSDYDQCTCQPSKDQRIRDVSIAIP